MREDVFSAQLVLVSSRTNESASGFYLRIRQELYAHVKRLFPQGDSKGKSLSDVVREDDFLRLDDGYEVVMPSGSWTSYEAGLDKERAFALTTREPRTNPYYKTASDRSLCTETIIRIFSALVRNGKTDAAVQVSVRCWVDYQPFAGFFKTRRLPRAAPQVIEDLVAMGDVKVLFAPRLISREELEKHPERKNAQRLYYPVIREYKVVSDAETLEAFKGHLCDPSRPVPLIVFFGDSWRHRREARFVAETCWAKCRVWILKMCVSGLSELLGTAIAGIDVARNFKLGYCRVFFPAGRYRQDDAAQIRYWVPLLMKRHFRKRISIGLQRFYCFDSAGWVTSKRELQLAEYEILTRSRLLEKDENEKIQEGLIRQLFSERDKARAAERCALSELSVARNTIIGCRVSHDELLRESAVAIDERDELINKVARLQKELLAVRGESAAASVASSALRSVILDDAPDDFNSLVWATRHAFPHLAVVPTAWDRMARKKNSSRHVAETWRMLWSLENVLFPMLMDQVCGHPSQKFQEKTGYAYSPKDSADLPPEMDRMRNVKFEGRVWRIEHHIKSGSRDATLLRVYFDVDMEGKRLIVGAIGDHLPTLGTVKNK